MAGKSWGNTKPRTNNDKPRLNDLVEIYDMPTGKFVDLRLVGPVTSMGTHWIEIIGSKSGNKANIPKICLNYNSITEELDDNGCPYCEGEQRLDKAYYCNAIVRELQDSEPRKKPKHTKKERKETNIGSKKEPYNCYVKERGSKSWSPIKGQRFPLTVASSIASLMEINRHTNKKTGKTRTYALSDPRYGCDIQVRKEKQKKGPVKYQVQKGSKRTPLTDEEKAYLHQNLDVRDLLVEDLETARREWEKLEKQLVGNDAEDDDDEYLDDKKGKKGKKSKGKSRDEDDDDDEDEGEDDDFDLDDDLEDEPKKKKGKKKTSSKPEKSSKSSTKKKKKKVVDDDEDDDD
jgi:hypothetical protein